MDGKGKVNLGSKECKQQRHETNPNLSGGLFNYQICYSTGKTNQYPEVFLLRLFYQCSFIS